MLEGMLGNLSLPDVLGPIDDLLMKMASSKGDLWLSELKHLLRQEPPWRRMHADRLSRSVLTKTLGRLQVEKIQVTSHALRIISETDLHGKYRTFEFSLFLRTRRQLHLSQHPTWKEFYERIGEEHLLPCPMGVAVELCYG